VVPKYGKSVADEFSVARQAAGQWGDQQQRWTNELVKQMDEVMDSITSFGQPSAGPTAPAGAAASATDGKP
jgi:hypothetical protein